METSADRGNRPIAAVVGRMAARVLTASLFLAVLAAIGLLMVLPRVTGATALTVLTGSMTPEIPVGSAVFIRPVDTESLKPGDIATYQKKERVDTYVTHRIVEVDSTTSPTNFIFKGDANRGADIDPVPATAIRGEVWFHVPYLGAVRDALNGKAGLTLLAILVLGGYALSQLAGAFRDHRHGRQSLATNSGHHSNILCDRPLVLADMPQWVDVISFTKRHHGLPLRQLGGSTTVLFAPSAPHLETLLLELGLIEGVSATTHRGPDATVLLSTMAEAPDSNDACAQEAPCAPTSA